MNKILPAHTYEYLLTRKCNMNCTYCFEKDKSGQDADLDKVYGSLLNNDFFSVFPTEKFYMFGGEPLLNIEFMDKLAQKIQENPKLSDKTKKKYINSIFSNITTNGTLIDKSLDILKKYNASLQISLDGPEDINDLCRIDYNGKGHFKQIMDNIKICQENGIRYTIHGALSKKNYKDFSRIVKWFLEMQLNNPIKNRGSISELLFHNYLQLVFEDNISDDDINILLQQYQDAVEIILFSDTLKDFDMESRRHCAEGFLARQGGKCSAANNMFAFDGDMYIYPCHRLMTSGMEKSPHEYSLGQLNSNEPWNYKLYEQFMDASNKGILYGQMYNFIDKESLNFMANWCPSTNLECTGLTNVYPVKHDILLAELQNFIPKLAEYYGLDLLDYVNNHKRK